MLHLDVKKTLPWILYLVFFSVLNETVFSVSTPAIQAEFALTSTGVGWMMTTFIVFFGVCTVIFGRLSDLYSIRLLLSLGVVVYAAGSLLGFALQADYAWVLVGRALQGIGSSALPALVTVIVVRYFEPEVRGQLFGSVGSVISFAAAFGPVLGGFVSGHFHWAVLFLIPVLTLVSLPFLLKILPAEPTKPGKIDLIGAGLMTFGLGCLILWLTYPDWPWLVAGAVLLAGFVVRILNVAEPFLDPKLLLNRPYRAGVFTTFTLFGSIMGLYFLLPLHLHNEAGVDASTIGLLLFPGAISGVFFGPFSGRMADRRGNPRVLAIGLGLLAIALSAMPGLLGLSARLGALVGLSAALVVLNVGMAFFNTGLLNGVSRTLPDDRTGVGMGLFNLAGFLAGAVGTAIVARLLDAKLGAPWVLAGLGAVVVAASVVYFLRVRRLGRDGANPV